MSRAPQTRIAPPFHTARTHRVRLQGTGTAQASGSKAPACSRPWLRVAALGLSLRLAGRAPPRASRPRRSFASWPGAGSDREEVARRGRDRRFEQLHQRCALETGRDQQAVTERDAHTLERRLDHHRVRTVAGPPPSGSQPASVSPVTDCPVPPLTGPLPPSLVPRERPREDESDHERGGGRMSGGGRPRRSHGTLYAGHRRTTVKDRKKEIGKGLLGKMLTDRGIDRDDL